MADNTERLLLQVDAATELLRRHLAEGEQPLAKFEQRAAKMAENVDRSVSDMGKRFGPFAQLAEDSAKRAERAFADSFSDIQKLAAKAIEAPTVRGNVNIGAADARAAADNAQRQALATRLVAEAAERASAGQGELTERTRLYVQAARAAALEADHHATELAREAGALERVEIELNQAGAGAQLLAVRQRGATNSAGALRSAMQGASYQVQDTFTQLSMGANVLSVVAIQGGQLAGQFANIEGKAGSFARFMIGPYGLALTAALLVLGPLTKGMFEFGDATDKAVDKLKEDAAESEITARAKKRFAESVDGLTVALKEQDKALRDVAAGERSSAERANIAARAKRDEALAIRQATAARLADAIAARDGFSLTGGGTSGVSIEQAAEAAKVVELRRQSVAADKAVAEAERQLNVTRVDLASEQAAISIDPVRRVTKLYDDRIKALKDQQREEARLGRQIGAASKQRLQELEVEKKAKVDAVQAAQSAAKRTPNNDQLGRTIGVDEARSIVASIGGRVTSGTRSTERQAELYADFVAGRHKGPVAKPGTSDHERGQAVDVAYGPGISIASIKEAFRKQGVALRQIIDEPAQKVIHVAFGKAGPSRSTVAKQEESARQKVLADDTAYTNDERQARRRLIEATRKTASTEQQRENLLAEDIAAEAAATRRTVANDLSAGKITQAQSEHLLQLNNATETQRLANLITERATRAIEQRYDAEQADLQGKLTLLRIGEGLASTETERRGVAQQILEIEQALRRKALERLRDTSQDPAEVQSASNELKRLPDVEKAEQRQADRSNAGPLDQYRARLRAATDDMGRGVEDAAVRGFGALEDAGSRATASAVTNLLHLKGVAGEVVGSIVADLARLAVQKAIVAAIGGGFGFAGGGRIGDVPGFAEGGSPGGLIQGPGTGTSDSILAILGDGRGPIRVSADEFIVNAAATRKNLPLLHAINSGRLPGYASGGSLSSPALPSLRSPRLPDAVNGSGRRQDRLLVDGEIRISPTSEFDARMENVSFRTISAAAEPIMAGAESRTIRRVNRPSLPGAPF